VTPFARWLLFGFVVMGAIPLQVRILPALLPDAWVPHLGLVTAFLCGLLLGEGPGVIVGFALGLLYDRFTAGQVGLHLVLLPLVGVGAGLLPRLLPEMLFSQQVMLLAVFMLLAELFGAVLYHMAGVVRFDGWLVLYQLIPAVLSNLLVGGALLVYASSGRRRRWSS